MTDKLGYEEFRNRCVLAASAETCYPPERKDWRERTLMGDYLFGHCGAVAYAVQKYFGGKVVSGVVDGERWLFNEVEGRTFCLASPGTPVPKRVRQVARLTHPRFEVFCDRLLEVP